VSEQRKAIGFLPFFFRFPARGKPKLPPLNNLGCIFGKIGEVG